MRAVKSILGALLLLAATAPLATAQDAAWPGKPGRYVFDVIRNGSSIGTQVVEIKQQGDVLTATTESTIAVKILGLVVYRMHQMLTETYQAGRLVAVRGETVDGDGKRLADLKREGDRWAGAYNKDARAFDCADCTATPMWNIASTGATNMIEASEGRLRRVRIVDKGIETLDLPEGKVEAHHFAVEGDIQRDVWYDAAGNLVAAAQLGRDGSKIRQNLISDPDGSRETTPQAADSPAP
ncbi:MAG TPA: DUF6134 family protein [Dongiaceae bacterium]|jgi:hypothetical protein|nr:DUF6134 family protein [Dongiaceae bacterium]